MAEIEHGMSAREYEDWWRYYREEPFGAMRDNLHAGIVASAIINSRMGRKSGGKSVAPADFLLRPKSEDKDRETRESLAWLMAVSKPKKVA